MIYLCRKRSMLLVLLIATIGMFTISSCTTYKNINYFEDIPDSLYGEAKNASAVTFTDPVIQSNDILQVNIMTLDPEANTALLNSQVQSTPSGTAGTTLSTNGFLVDKNGMIELPVVGKIHVAGLTTAVARDTIHALIARYYKNPVVNVKFVNFSVTVLGEVAHPGAYQIPSEKVSILDVIGMAGDLTIYGKRESVLLMRDSSGHKQFTRFNLNSSKQLLNSPFFYLKQGDVVYVAPNKSKLVASDAIKTRNYAIAVSVISLLVIIISRL